jgi:hypothetical protein
MTPGGTEGYLQRLNRALRKRGVLDTTILEEAREHLADAVEQGCRDGRSRAAAQEEAFARFGAPETVAAQCAADQFRRWHGGLLVVSIIIGVAVAYVDSRPTWDDTGITAGVMLLMAGLLGLLGPQRPWLWAIGVGIWIPAYALVRAPSLPTLAMLMVLVFPFVGAYLGAATRRWATMMCS